MVSEETLCYSKHYSTQATLNGRELKLEGWYIVIDEAGAKNGVREAADFVGWMVADVTIEDQSVVLIHAGLKAKSILPVAESEKEAEEIMEEILEMT